jgi:hypothetical protein
MFNICKWSRKNVLGIRLPSQHSNVVKHCIAHSNYGLIGNIEYSYTVILKCAYCGKVKVLTGVKAVQLKTLGFSDAQINFFNSRPD